VDGNLYQAMGSEYGDSLPSRGAVQAADAEKMFSLEDESVFSFQFSVFNLQFSAFSFQSA
jgi:hypothetical protein